MNGVIVLDGSSIIHKLFRITEVQSLHKAEREPALATPTMSLHGILPRVTQASI